MCMGNHTSPSVSPSSRRVESEQGGKGSTIRTETCLTWLPLVSAQKDRFVERREQEVCSYSLVSAPHETKEHEWGRQLLRNLHALPQIQPDVWFLCVSKRQPSYCDLSPGFYTTHGWARDIAKSWVSVLHHLTLFWLHSHLCTVMGKARLEQD